MNNTAINTYNILCDNFKLSPAELLDLAAIIHKKNTVAKVKTPITEDDPYSKLRDKHAIMLLMRRKNKI